MLPTSSAAVGGDAATEIKNPALPLKICLDTISEGPRTVSRMVSERAVPLTTVPEGARITKRTGARGVCDVDRITRRILSGRKTA